MIVDLQRSVRTVGRIRIGQQTPTRSGKMAPTKLDTFRLSSPQRAAIERAAQLYGGHVAPMTSDRSDDQWEVVTEVASLPVVIPPTSHLSQFYEQWDAAGCQRRCDGREASVMDGRPTRGVTCACDPDRRDCTITTRLSVVLPELEALGVWRLDTKGWYAATELAGAADLCAAATGRGLSIPARLDLEARTRRSRGPDGKPQTFRFAVPVLSVDVSLPQARAILGGQPDTTISTPPRALNVASDDVADRSLGTRSTTPISPPPAAELPPPPPGDIPTPRTHDEFTQAQLDADTPPAEDTPDAPAAPAGKLTDAQRFAMNLGVDDDGRHKLYAIVTGNPDARYDDLTPRQRNQVARHDNAIQRGDTTLEQLETEAQAG